MAITKLDIEQALKPEITYVTDAIGYHKLTRMVKNVTIVEGKIVKEYGISVKILKTPSSEYREKMDAKKIIEAEKAELQKIEDDKRKIIDDKIKEIAVAELVKEGTFSVDGAILENPLTEEKP